MTRSIIVKMLQTPVCTHTMYDETEVEVFNNAQEQGIKEHG